MNRPCGAARSRRRLHPGRVALVLVVVLLATGLRVATQTSAGWADDPAPTAVVLNPVADAMVSADKPKTNFGRSSKLETDGKPRLESYLRFTVPAGAAGRAVLRLWAVDSKKDGPKVRRYNGALNETAVTWNNRATPLLGTPIVARPLKKASWAEWDVSNLLPPAAADVTLAVVANGSDGVEFGSRETSHSPQLVITPSLPPTTSSTTSTSTTTTTTEPPTTTTLEPPTTTTTEPPTTTTTDPGIAPECAGDWAQAAPMAKLSSGLGEMSGFVASPNHQEWGWGIRDSGNPASLYAVRPNDDGSATTQEFRAYGLDNSDWEDLAYTPGFEEGTGHLWVLENVANSWTGARWIYQFEELDPDNPPPPPPTTTTTTTTTTLPDPTVPTDESTTTTLPEETTTTTTTVPPPPPPPPPPPASLVGAYQWAYPDIQANTETMFVFDGDLVVVSKTTPSRVYRFNGPLLPFTVNVPTFVGTLPAGNVLSIAAMSADQRTLAFSNHGKIDVYENRHDIHDLAGLIANPVFHQDMATDNREGGAFFPYGSCDLVLVAESKTLWRLRHR